MSAAAFSYASFSRGAGGWQVGELLGPLDEGRMRSLLGAVPTQLSDGTPVPTYPDRAERARLVRRFAWLPAPWDPQVKVFFSSVPAGSDATGRPGNVFTYVSVCGEPGIPVSAAVSAMFSPDIPTPFGPRETEAARIPVQPAQAGPVAGLVPIFLDGWDEEHPPLPEIFAAVTNGTRRRDLARFLAATLDAGDPVVLGCPPAEAPLWVAAVHAERPHMDFCFSTFERTPSVADVLSLGAQLVIVPLQDIDRVRVTVPGATVIATTDDIPAPPAAPEPVVDALANPFDEVPEPVPAPAPDLSVQLAEVTDYLSRPGTPPHLTVGLTLSPTVEQNMFLHAAGVQDWINVLHGEVEEPLSVSEVLGLLLFPPDSFIGGRTRAMVLAAEAVEPLSSSAVTRFGWLFDLPADLQEEICRDAATQIPEDSELETPREAGLPVTDLVRVVVDKHHARRTRTQVRK